MACGSSNAFYRPELPLVLACSLALFVMSSAAEVAVEFGKGGELFRGHGRGSFRSEVFAVIW